MCLRGINRLASTGNRQGITFVVSQVRVRPGEESLGVLVPRPSTYPQVATASPWFALLALSADVEQADPVLRRRRDYIRPQPASERRKLRRQPGGLAATERQYSIR
jgi:hypothetical protein